MSEQRSGLKVTASDALEFEPVVPKIKKAGSVLKTILFVIVAVGGGAAGWAFYGDRIIAMIGDAESDVPIVRADDGPVKVRPETPGGLQVPDRDKLVYNRIQGSGVDPEPSPTVERLLPPPETPVLNPDLSSPVSSPAVSSSASAATDTPSVSQPVAPVPAARVPEAVPATTPGTAITMTTPVAATDGIPVPPAKPKHVDETPRVADVKNAVEPVAAPPAPPAPLIKNAYSPPAPVKSATTDMKTGTRSMQKPKVTPATAAATKPPATTTYQVQLAAARSEAAARGEWDKLRRKNLDLLGNLGLNITRADLGTSKGIFYRLRAGPLASVAAARTLCSALAKRKVSCLVVRPGK